MGNTGATQATTTSPSSVANASGCLSHSLHSKVSSSGLVLAGDASPNLSTASHGRLHSSSTKRKAKSKDNLLFDTTSGSANVASLNVATLSGVDEHLSGFLDTSELAHQPRLTSSTFTPSSHLAVAVAKTTTPLIERRRLTAATSRDNLSTCGGGGGDGLAVHVALYDYKANLDKHLHMSKGDQLVVIGHNKSNEWSEVRNVHTGQVGWAPTSYIKPLNSLDSYAWYHGKIERVKAEYLLSSGINGSFLVRESETCANQLSISLRWEGRVYVSPHLTKLKKWTILDLCSLNECVFVFC